MRLVHVLDKHPEFKELKDIPKLIEAMVEDIRRECSGEYENCKAVHKSIGNKTVQLFKEHLQSVLLNKENKSE
jgi:hypothetical protein